MRFSIQVFFMHQCPPGSWVFPWGRFELFRKFTEIFSNECLSPVSTTPEAFSRQMATTTQKLLFWQFHILCFFLTPALQGKGRLRTLKDEGDSVVPSTRTWTWRSEHFGNSKIFTFKHNKKRVEMYTCKWNIASRVRSLHLLEFVYSQTRIQLI